MYIDNDKDSCDLLETLFSLEGFELTHCGDPKTALGLTKNKGYAAIVLEYRLGSVSGPDLCRQIREFDLMTPIVFYSASAFPADRREGFAAGADDYLVKPNDFERLMNVVRSLVKNAKGTAAGDGCQRLQAPERSKTLIAGDHFMPVGCAAVVLGVVSIMST